MKFRILLYTLLILVSCKKEDTAFQLPSNIFSVVRVYDVGNSGDASDIRAYFKLTQTSNVTESRVIISKAGSLTASNAMQLSADRFLSIPIPISGTTLTARSVNTQKDSDGNAITAGVPYNVFVLLIGKDNATLLSPANPITLQDKPIYAGQYTGLWNTAIYTNFPVSVIIDNDYDGQLFYTSNFTPCCGDSPDNGPIELTIDGSTIVTFEYDEALATYKGGCYATFLGSGSIATDIFITIHFTGHDCDGDHGNGILTLTRLPE